MSTPEQSDLVIDEEFKALLRPLSPDEAEELTDSLKVEGCRDALVVWQETGKLLDGHHRLQICKRWGIPFHVVAVSLPNLDAATKWIVKNQGARRSWTPFEKYEALVRAGVVVEMAIAAKARQGTRTDLLATLPGGPGSGEVRDKLKPQLGVSPRTAGKIKFLHENASEELKAQLRGKDSLHIHTVYMRCRSEMNRRALQQVVDTQRAPHVPDQPVTQPGDIWYLGEHAIICGDARSKGDLRWLMGVRRREGKAEVARAACLWSDPPYGVDLPRKIKGDTKEELRPLLRAAFRAIDGVLEPGAPLYICHPAGELAAVFILAALRVRWHIHQGLVWLKDTLVAGNSDYQYRHEPILYGWKDGPGTHRRVPGKGPPRWSGGNDADSVLVHPRPKRSDAHPTMKPVPLIAQCLLNSTKAGDVVLDPFAGSGSTILACEETGRVGRAIEIDAANVDHAIGRWIEEHGPMDIALKRGDELTIFNDPETMPHGRKPRSPLEREAHSPGA